jgi:hypothetical protein
LKRPYVEQSSLLDVDNQADRRHEALTLQIIAKSNGITYENIKLKQRQFGYEYLTVKHLRNLQRRGIIESYGAEPKHWRLRQP